MPASQSPAPSISTSVSGGFPAVSLAHKPRVSRAGCAAPSRSPSRKSAFSARAVSAGNIPTYPPLASQTESASSPRSQLMRKCDKSLSAPDSAESSCAHIPPLQPSPALQADAAVPVTPHPDSALHTAARPKTDAALLEQMVTLRRAGKSLRQIGRQTGRCMEGVRQALLRYEQARAETPAQYAQEEEWHEPLRDPDPLPAGHPIATQAIWRGLEHWRDVV